MWPFDTLRLQDLLGQLAPLSDHERVRRVLQLGLRARGGDGKAAQLLGELGAGDAYQRRLALKACYQSRDGALVLRLVSDASRLLRGGARKLVALCCDDAQALQALQECYPVRQHLPILKALRARDRLAPIDAFLDWLSREPGDTRFADLLPYGSPAAILRHLAQALQRPSPLFWRGLAARLPERALVLLHERVTALPPDGHPDSDLRTLLDQLLPDLCRALPEPAAPLVEALLARGVPLPAGTFAHLIQGCPQRAFDIYERHRQRIGHATFERVVPALGAERVHRAIAQSPGLLGDASRWFPLLPAAEQQRVLRGWLAGLDEYPHYAERLLRHLDPQRDAADRERAFQRFRVRAQDREGIISVALLKDLPPDLRAREARRHLHEVPALATRPAARLPYCALLSWEEAQGILQLYIGHPEGEVRGRAVALLIGIAGGEPARCAEALRMVRARKNEQDPVRLAMLSALNGWPRERWRPEHLDDVGGIVRDALDAADLSPASAQAAELLVLRTFWVDGERGARWLATLLKERGRIHHPGLGAYLSDEDVRRAAPHLLAIASAWANREREAQLISLCQSLGARIPLVAGLTDVMITMIDRAPASAAGCSVALQLLLPLSEHARPCFLEVLPRVGEAWRRSGYYGPIISLAQRHGAALPAPELLLRLLEQVAEATHNEHEAHSALTTLRCLSRPRFEALLGELLRRDGSFVLLPLIHQHLEWRRQDLLTPFLQDRKMSGRFATGRTRWVLPFQRGFFRWSPEQHRLYAAALDALVDDPQRDTPTVFWAIDRRVGLCFTDAGGVLRLASDGRAAVQEKGIRALSRLDAGQGVPTLLSCLDDARARIAIYAFRRAVLELPPARAVALLRAVPLRKVTVAKEVLRLLGELRTEEAYRLLLALDQPTLHRDIRIALLRSLWDHLERAETWELYARAVQDRDWLLSLKLAEIPAQRLTAFSEPRLAALLARLLHREEPEARMELLRRAAQLPIRDRERPFLHACLRLLDSPYPDERAAATDAVLVRATEQDVPAVLARVTEIAPQRQALASCLGQLTAALARRSAVLEALAEGVEGTLAQDPLLAPQLIRLAVARRPAEGPALARLLDRLCAAGRFHVDVALAAREALGALRLEPRHRAALEQQLGAHEHEGLRWLGLALLEEAARQQGWTEEHRARLARYQADEAPLVAGAAQHIFPPPRAPAPPPAS